MIKKTKTIIIEYRQHVVTFFIHFVVFFLDVELSEEVKRNDRVNVDDDRE